MLKENSKLRAEARAALSNKWLMAAIVAFVWVGLTGGASAIPVVGILIYLILLPLQYGFSIVLLRVFRGEEVNIGGLFDGFNDFGRIVGTKILQLVYIFLWSLLLIIPGIVKRYSYAMTDYILKDEPQLTNNAVIEKSMAMMSGNKMKLFLLDLSFIGWALLAILTCGISLFFLYAYVHTAYSAFYEDLKTSYSVAS